MTEEDYAVLKFQTVAAIASRLIAASIAKSDGPIELEPERAAVLALAIYDAADRICESSTWARKVLGQANAGS